MVHRWRRRRLGRHVGKCAVAVVAIQRIAAVGGDIDILVAVVIVVADGDAHAVAVLRHAGETSLFSHVGERSVFVLMVEAIPIFAIAFVGVRAGGWIRRRRW